MEDTRGFFDKAKAAMGQAAARAKEEVDDLQARRDLGNAEKELGKAAFELVEAGELEHPVLEEHAAKIRELRARVEREDDDADTEAEADADADVDAPEPDDADADGS